MSQTKESTSGLHQYRYRISTNLNPLSDWLKLDAANDKSAMCIMASRHGYRAGVNWALKDFHRATQTRYWIGLPTPTPAKAYGSVSDMRERELWDDKGRMIGQAVLIWNVPEEERPPKPRVRVKAAVTKATKKTGTSVVALPKNNTVLKDTVKAQSPAKDFGKATGPAPSNRMLSEVEQ